MADEEPFRFTGGEITDFSLDITPNLKTGDELQERFNAAVRASGCPACGVLVLQRVHLCEHGVTPAPTYETSVTVEFEDLSLYRKLTGETYLDDGD